jgi:hypothetical protein
MAAELSQSLEFSRSTQPERRSAAELLAPGSNPLLTFQEKMYVRMLVRGTSFEPSERPDAVEQRGLSQRSMELLHKLILTEDGRKKSFAEATGNLRQKPNADVHPHVRDTDTKLSRALVTVTSGISGDLNGVVERVCTGQANCLEAAVVLQLVARVFYPEEISKAQLLAYSTEGASSANLMHREFALFTQEQDSTGRRSFLNRYMGQAKEYSKEMALQIAQQARDGKAKGMEELFVGFVRLMEQGEQF